MLPKLFDKFRFFFAVKTQPPAPVWTLRSPIDFSVDSMPNVRVRVFFSLTKKTTTTTMEWHGLKMQPAFIYLKCTNKRRKDRFLCELVFFIVAFDDDDDDDLSPVRSAMCDIVLL